MNKIAIFTKDGRPQHAAWQLNDGTSTSKCGRLEDISHPLDALEGDEFGTVSVTWLDREARLDDHAPAHA